MVQGGLFVELRADARHGCTRRSGSSVPEIRIDTAAILVAHITAVVKHCYHACTKSSCWTLRFACCVSHVGDRELVKMRTARDRHVESASVAKVGRAREAGQLRSRGERGRCWTHSATVADGAVKRLRRAWPAREFESVVARTRRWTGRHGRCTVRHTGISSRLLHLKAVGSAVAVLFEFEAG